MSVMDRDCSVNLVTSVNGEVRLRVGGHPNAKQDRNSDQLLRQQQERLVTCTLTLARQVDDLKKVNSELKAKHHAEITSMEGVYRQQLADLEYTRSENDEQALTLARQVDDLKKVNSELEAKHHADIISIERVYHQQLADLESTMSEHDKLHKQELSAICAKLHTLHKEHRTVASQLKAENIRALHMSKQEMRKREAQHAKDLEQIRIELEGERAILDEQINQVQQVCQQKMTLESELAKADEMYSKLQEKEMRGREYVQYLWHSLEVAKEEQVGLCWESFARK